MSYRTLRNASTGILAALVAGGCICSTSAQLHLSRMPEDKAGLPTVLVCPGEEVAFLWQTSNAVEASIDNNVGQVTPVGGGSKPWVAPQELTHFLLTAVGDQCNATAPATIHTVRDGEEYMINMAGEKDRFLWNGLVSLQFASPSIEVTEVKLAPETAASHPGWNVQRDNVAGISGPTLSAVLENETWTRVTPFPLVGAYQMAPVGSASNALATGNPATIVAKLRCRR